MEIIEKEQFCFSILNQLLDEYNLHIDSYTKLTNQIWEANTHSAINGILRFLQYSLLIAMKDKIISIEDNMIVKFSYLKNGDDFYLNNVKHRKQREWSVNRYNAAIIDDSVITDSPFVHIDDNTSVLPSRMDVN